jgi:peptidylprolyl isomerase
MESPTSQITWGPRKRACVGDTVQVHYTGKLDDGTVCLASAGRRPLQFIVGRQRIILGIDEAVVGMYVGETRIVAVQPRDAFGERRDGMLITVDEKKLQGGSVPEIGQRLWTTCENGRRVSVTVAEVSGSEVTLDTNHPLAGKVITFEVSLVGIL